jgi:putative ABC transport system permease protein
MILGIALGVSVVIAIDIANVSARRAFELSTETVTGKATHQIVGGPSGLDEGIYTRLRRLALPAPSTPVISEIVSSEQIGNLPLELLGIDPFTEAPFRSYLGSSGTIGDLATFLTRPGALIISSDLARRFGLEACPKSGEACQVTLSVAGRQQPAFIAGLIEPTDNLSRRALQNIILADIATAQELTGRLGKIDRIDLILSSQCAQGSPGRQAICPENVSSLLPAGAHLQPVEARQGAIDQMTRAFSLNLTALSLLALVVGLFLIYNTMTFSVVQRRPVFGALRVLGATRQEVFSLILAEALIIGIIGSAIGGLLGGLLGQGAVRLVTQTINDLFFVLSVRGLQVPAFSLFKGALLGILATLLAAAPPAWEAASTAPHAALSRSGVEAKARRAVVLAAVAGLAVCLGGAGLLLVSSAELVVNFAGTFAVIVGLSMLAPLATMVAMRLVAPPLGSILGSLGRMAPRNLVSSISRIAIAVAALMVAVSVTIGVSVMVSSFRYTVIAWLEQTLQGDIYISPAGVASGRSPASINPEILDKLEGWPGVSETLRLRSVDVDSPAGPVHIAATDNPTVSQERSYLAQNGSLASIRQGMQAGGILISEPLANRLGITDLPAGLTLFTDSGAREFPILGIYYDYASVQGSVLMALDVYRRNWQDGAITAAALKLAPGVDADELVEQQKTTLTPLQSLVIRPNRILKQEVLEVFDRTFAITGAMQLLATIVAFIGILSALLSVELERQRELGILRAVGMSIRQLWGLMLLETGLIGATAGILAMPSGLILAVILIFIINQRSFGWTLQMDLIPQPFIQALLIAILAALLAGIYPAARLGRLAVSRAIRSE